MVSTIPNNLNQKSYIKQVALQLIAEKPIIISTLYKSLCYIVDGGWSSWTYGPCSKTCGRGTQTLTRRCDSPTPYCDGKDCSGLRITQNTCINRCCPGKIMKITLSTCARPCVHVLVRLSMQLCVHMCMYTCLLCL